MKTKKNEIALLIGLLGIAVAVAVYILVFNPYQDKTEAVRADNVVQGEYLAKLEDWASRTEQMQKDTEKMIQEVNTTFSRFPVKSKSEDAIMYAAGLESQDPETYISAIGITDPLLCYEAQPTGVKLKDTDQLATHTYQLYNQKITYTQQFTYDGMKRYVNSIVKDSNRKSIESLNVAYDSSTGILIGVTEMNLYTLTGTESEYQKTSIPPMPVGTSDIFGSLNKSAIAPVVQSAEE